MLINPRIFLLNRVYRRAQTKQRLRVITYIAIVVAVLMRFLMPPSDWIEQHYSNGFYPICDAIVRKVSDWIPFSIGDVLLIVVFIAFLLTWFVGLRKVLRKRRLHDLADPLLGTCGALAFAFIVFMGSWAYNYNRIPVKQKMVLHPHRVDAAAVTALADRTLLMLNANAKAAHAERYYDDVVMQRLLEPTFYATTRRLGNREVFAPAPIKPTIFEPFMRASATYGFTDPFTHEINLSSSLFSIERPAAYAHEWSHLSGFADESEANFIAAIACITSKDPALRYSGWMLVWFNLPSTVHVHHRASRLVIADVKAIIGRYRRETKPAIEHAQRAVYERYLHANNVPAGFASYHLFIQLITAGEFDRNGLPVVKRGV
jgi:hypothetical protein